MAAVRRGMLRALRALPRTALPMSRRVAWKSSKTGSSESLSNADIAKAFLEMDAAASTSTASTLPVKLTGISGGLVEGLHAGAKGNMKVFEGRVRELAAVVEAVNKAGMVVDRFFATSNYSPTECKLVVDLLTTSKEPLTSFDGIKNAEVKELIVDNAGNLEAWKAARAAVGAVGLSTEAKAVLESLATAARLDLLRKVVEKGHDLMAVLSKAVEAVVTSAVPLSKDQQAAITKALPQYAPAGTSLTTKFIVEPAIIGGVIVSIKNQTIDLSVSSRLIEVASARAQHLA